jgi:hypothetical protein
MEVNRSGCTCLPHKFSINSSMGNGVGFSDFRKVIFSITFSPKSKVNPLHFLLGKDMYVSMNTHTHIHTHTFFKIMTYL